MSGDREEVITVAADLDALNARAKPIEVAPTGAALDGARRLLYCGLFGSSLLVFRVSGITVGDALVLFAAVLALVNSLGRRVDIRISFLSVAAMALIATSTALASLRSEEPVANMIVGVRVAFLAVGLVALFKVLLNCQAYVLRATAAWCAGAALCGAGTLVQYLLGDDVISGAYVTTAGRYTGFTQHPTDIGGITSVGAVLLFTWVVGGTNWRTRAAASTGLALCAVGLILSGSVSGMLAATLGLLYLIIRNKFSTASMLATLAVTGAAAIAALQLQTATVNALSPIDRLLQTLGFTATRSAIDVNTSEARIDTYISGLEGFLANPLIGTGLDYSSGIVGNSFQVHNILLAAAYQGGFFLLLAVFGMIISGLRGVFGIFRQSWAAYIYAGALAAMAFAMTAPSMYNRYLWIPIALSSITTVLERARDGR